MSLSDYPRYTHTRSIIAKQTRAYLFISALNPLHTGPYFLSLYIIKGGYSAYFFWRVHHHRIVCMYGKHNTRTESGQDVVVPNQQPTSRVLYNIIAEARNVVVICLCVVASSLARSFFLSPDATTQYLLFVGRGG